MSMDIRLLALDIDDTLVDMSSIIPPRTMAALHKAREQGVHIVLATGRGYAGTRNIRQQLGEGYRHIICFGGALVADYATGEPILHHFLDPEEVALSLRLGKELGIHAQIYQGDTVVFAKRNAFTDQYCSTQGLSWREEERLFEHEWSIVPKVLLYAPENAEACMAAVQAALPPQLHALTSKPGFIEIGSRQVTKGTALQALGEHLGIPRENIAAIGDNTLDQDMITYAGVGCCVGNGNEAVKAVADMILPSQQLEGVAWFIENCVLTTEP